MAPDTSGDALDPILRGKRILIVEDNLLVSMDVEATLAGAGCEIVGPASRIAQALSLAQSERIDAAILDVNLDGELSFPIADTLLRRDVPVVLATGYDPAATVPEAYRHLPSVQKPFGKDEIRATLLRALSRC